MLQLEDAVGSANEAQPVPVQPLVSLGELFSTILEAIHAEVSKTMARLATQQESIAVPLLWPLPSLIPG